VAAKVVVGRQCGGTPLGNIEKDLAQAILAPSGLSASKLGLRFDRVVVAVLRDLRSFTNAAAPKDVAVLVTITAPIRQPAKTAEDLQRDIGELLSGRAAGGDRSAVVRGNDTRLRLVAGVPEERPRLIGFVHNRGSMPETLFDLTEQWLRDLDRS
jgi:hypothetical protein